MLQYNVNHKETDVDYKPDSRETVF